MTVRVPADIRCFECDHSYAYLGDGTHPGQCPRCRSRAVSPAGRFESAAVVEAPPTDDPPRLTVVGTDETYRTFLLELECDDNRRVTVTLVQIEELVVPGDALPSDSRLWLALDSILDEHDSSIELTPPDAPRSSIR